MKLNSTNIWLKVKENIRILYVEFIHKSFKLRCGTHMISEIYVYVEQSLNHWQGTFIGN